MSILSLIAIATKSQALLWYAPFDPLFQSGKSARGDLEHRVMCPGPDIRSKGLRACGKKDSSIAGGNVSAKEFR